MTRFTIRALIPQVACVFAPGVVACVPLPIPHNEQVTPFAAGDVRRSDGAPVVGAPVALTRSPRDTLCMKAAIRRSTDSVGHFAFPATEKHKHILWFTMMESFGSTSYWLRAGTIDSAGDTVYRTRTYIPGHVWGDSLACITWVWRDGERITCDNVGGARRIVTGGEWTDGNTSGPYRVILAEEGAWGTWNFRGFVQWLEQSSRRNEVKVRAMTELPVGPELQAPFEGAQFAYNGGHWYVMCPSTKRTKWNRTRWLKFELGPPGQVRQVLNQ
jgi:hypothetical protein